MLRQSINRNDFSFLSLFRLKMGFQSDQSKPSPGIYIQTSINYANMYNNTGMNQMHARDSPEGVDCCCDETQDPMKTRFNTPSG